MTKHVRRATATDWPMAAALMCIDIELTERCNNDCIHCSINQPRDDETLRSKEMSTPFVKRILDEAADLGCLTVRFTGGEPLLREDFRELYLHARHRGMRVLLFTNGCLITPAIAKLLATVAPGQPVEVSVYGMSAESYESATRTPGSFALFQRGIGLLDEYRVPYVVKWALLPCNRSEYDEFVAWASRLPAMSGRPGCAIFFELRCRRDSAKKNSEIRSLRVPAARGVSHIMEHSPSYSQQLEEYAVTKMHPPDARLFRCGAGKRPCVDAYGRIQPCLGVRSPELTIDAAEMSVAGCLEHFTELAERRGVSDEYIKRCARCVLVDLCDQCPGASWKEHGTLDTPVEYLCEIAHAHAWALGWLSEDTHGWEDESTWEGV